MQRPPSFLRNDINEKAIATSIISTRRILFSNTYFTTFLQLLSIQQKAYTIPSSMIGNTFLKNKKQSLILLLSKKAIEKTLLSLEVCKTSRNAYNQKIRRQTYFVSVESRFLIGTNQSRLHVFPYSGAVVSSPPLVGKVEHAKGCKPLDGSHKRRTHNCVRRQFFKSLHR